MKTDQIFGLLLILLAIWLGVNATRGDTSPDVAGNTDDPVTVAPGSGGDGETGADSGDDGTDDDARARQRRREARRKAEARRQRRRANREPLIADSDFCAAAPATSKWSDLAPANDAAVRCMEAADVVTGTATDEFNPKDAVTRGQAAAAIAGLIDAANRLERKGVDLRPLPEPDDARFADVSADSPNELAIARLDETIVLQGYVDARFEPRGRVTRAQMASLLDRAYQYLNRSALPIGSDRFRDDEQSVHEESINAVAAAQVMEGRGNRRFAPRRSVLRGELASYLARILIRMEDKNRIAPLS